MVERLGALRQAEDTLAFCGLDEPKCPHCGQGCSVSDNEWWHLYEDGEHEVECPACSLEFTVISHVSYRFSTETQDEGEEE